MILGLTGTLCAGKDTVADLLVATHGFARDSLSDIIREEATRRGIPHDRTSLVNLGNTLRHQHGTAGYLAELAVQRFKAKGVPHTVIVSIRNPAEVQRFRQEPQFYLLALDAPVELRYQRLRERGRIGDEISLEQFVAQEQREMSSPDPLHQQIQQTIALADETFRNSGTIRELEAAVAELVQRLAR